MGETIEAGDTTDRVKPWTIKGIAPEERNAAIAAAGAGRPHHWCIRTQVQADLADLERMITLAEKIASANGQPIPPGITRAAYALMRDHLRDIKAGRTASPRSRTVEAVE
jgi:hypothetical protein